jgi:hypothetical protein
LCVRCFRLRRKNKNLKNRLPAKKAQNACRAVVIRPRSQFYLENSRLIFVLVVQVTTRIRRRRFFFLQVASRKKGKNQVPTSYLQDSPSSFFCPTSRSSQESKGFVFRRATYKVTYVEAVESARAGLSPKKKRGT